ncbi:hypothetical protein SELMODRAFT_407845 [Selaginella moellendorffii]|uniref:Peptide deformylase n=1 Tax=Selaginella moellendorffii TaxID=88036 RepID=D8R4Y4_SELML|nr:hypothetical protein SELMODRAFT_407845 [Selaginella moellendorffii]
MRAHSGNSSSSSEDDNGSYMTVHRERKPMLRLRGIGWLCGIQFQSQHCLVSRSQAPARNIRINSFDDNVKKLMLDVTYRRDGIGLLTPQLGVNARLMVFNPEGERGKGKRDRYRSELKSQDINGKKYGSWTARIFRHEYDHLEGVLYIDQMTPRSLNSIGQELLNLEEEFEKRSGTPPPDAFKDKLCSVRLRAPFSTYRKFQLVKNNKPKSESNRASCCRRSRATRPSENDMADLHIILVNAEKRIRALTASKTTSVKRPEEVRVFRARKWSESSGCLSRRRENEDMSGKAGVSTQGRPSCDSGIQTQQQRWQRKFRKISVRNREKQLDDGQDVEIGVEG